MEPFGRPALAAGGEAARERVRHLLELQRATLLMYASCAWFFDDIAGLEASLVIRIGAHAMDLMRQAGGTPPVRQVLEALAEGKSNLPEAGTGADVFRKVAEHQVTASHAVAGAALEALVSPQAFDTQAVPGFDVTLSGHLEEAAPGLRRLEGTARARQRRLGVDEELTFTAITRPDGQFEARVGGRRLSLDDLGDEARGTLVMAALPMLLQEVRSPKVARLVAAAAREVPPDGDTPAGVARRTLLARVVLILLGRGGGRARRRVAADLRRAVRPAGAPRGIARTARHRGACLGADRAGSPERGAACVFRKGRFRPERHGGRDRPFLIFRSFLPSRSS